MKRMLFINYILEHKWAIVTCIGAIIVAVGALKSAMDQTESDKLAKALQKELAEKTTKISELQELTIELQKKNIEELNHQRSLITGGKTVPIFQFLSYSRQPHVFVPHVNSAGKYPLYNLNIKVKYISGMNKGKELDISFEELRQGTMKTFPKELVFDLKKDPDLKLEVHLHARNGSWKEVINFRKTPDGKYQRELILTSMYGDQTPIVHLSFEKENQLIGSLYEGIKSLEQFN
ncbi:hypothetical protein [Tenacibaculum mesophilum]|uniref:hypothetical protein n=1 Tax=Tenacibaculum mesophilum TaxID=104268 RepID=UPI00064A8541|nr:hypothetical protein [Tenacibaculum mesophilum]